MQSSPSFVAHRSRWSGVSPMSRQAMAPQAPQARSQAFVVPLCRDGKLVPQPSRLAGSSGRNARQSKSPNSSRAFSKLVGILYGFSPARWDSMHVLFAITPREDVTKVLPVMTKRPAVQTTTKSTTARRWKSLKLSVPATARMPGPPGAKRNAKQAQNCQNCNKTKYLWFRQPMQFPTREQWWSIRSTQVPQREQWCALSGRTLSQWAQREAFPGTQRRARHFHGSNGWTQNQGFPPSMHSSWNSSFVASLHCDRMAAAPSPAIQACHSSHAGVPGFVKAVRTKHHTARPKALA
mmetsp:Transcript_81842/g.227992  ORF Transcript_81842/g.227992 Transcript_81842/m.227992 type:complete len:294 (-) Transcript_81842:354-1235(-)